MKWLKEAFSFICCLILIALSVAWCIQLMVYMACADHKDTMGYIPTLDDLKLFIIFFFGGGIILTLLWFLYYHLLLKKTESFKTL